VTWRGDEPPAAALRHSWAGAEVLSAVSRLARKSGAVVVARGVNTADGCVPTMLLKVPCDVSVVEDGD
jgi:EAL domain-containing protein (putative c-di-GMP-specific phosphodiesterase class I)